MQKQIEKLKERKFSCPLCEDKLDIRFDEKHGKPYVICNSCGVQMFVRREEGIQLMVKKTETLWDYFT